MSKMPNLNYILEELIDKAGLANVLYLIAEVCREKADHIQASYSDRSTARAWNTAANAVDRCAAKDAIQRL